MYGLMEDCDDDKDVSGGLYSVKYSSHRQNLLSKKETYIFAVLCHLFLRFRTLH
jgi:hypothetical protein